jgi:hypothetical protein
VLLAAALSVNATVTSLDWWGNLFGDVWAAALTDA